MKSTKTTSNRIPTECHSVINIELFAYYVIFKAITSTEINWLPPKSVRSACTLIIYRVTGYCTHSDRSDFRLNYVLTIIIITIKVLREIRTYIGLIKVYRIVRSKYEDTIQEDAHVCFDERKRRVNKIRR